MGWLDVLRIRYFQLYTYHPSYPELTLITLTLGKFRAADVIKAKYVQIFKLDIWDAD